MTTTELQVDRGGKAGPAVFELTHTAISMRSTHEAQELSFSEVKRICLYQFVDEGRRIVGCEVRPQSGPDLVVTAGLQGAPEYNDFLQTLHDRLLRSGSEIQFYAGSFLFFGAGAAITVITLGLGFLAWSFDDWFGAHARKFAGLGGLGFVTLLVTLWRRPRRYHPSAIPQGFLI